jgi:hypothetical protein
MIADLASALGLDSLIAALVLVPWFPTWPRRCRVAAMLGLADGVATLVRDLSSGVLPEWALLLSIVLILGALLLVRPPQWLDWALSVCLSVDNLMSADPPAIAPLLGIASASMAMLGFVLGAGFGRMANRLGADT